MTWENYFLNIYIGEHIYTRATIFINDKDMTCASEIRFANCQIELTFTIIGPYRTHLRVKKMNKFYNWSINSVRIGSLKI